MIWNFEIKIEINGAPYYYQVQSLLDFQPGPEKWTTIGVKGFTDSSLDAQDFKYSIGQKKFDRSFNNLEIGQQERLLKIVHQMHLVVEGGAEDW